MKTLSDARNAAASALGYNLVGKGGELTQAEFFKLDSATADVVAASPADYPANVVQWATKTRSSSFYGQGPVTLSVGDKVGIFAAEFASQAEQINPLSQQNRAKTKWTLTVIISLVAVAFAAVWAWKSAPSTPTLPRRK